MLTVRLRISSVFPDPRACPPVSSNKAPGASLPLRPSPLAPRAGHGPGWAASESGGGGRGGREPLFLPETQGRRSLPRAHLEGGRPTAGVGAASLPHSEALGGLRYPSDSPRGRRTRKGLACSSGITGRPSVRHGWRRHQAQRALQPSPGSEVFKPQRLFGDGRGSPPLGLLTGT